MKKTKHTALLFIGRKKAKHETALLWQKKILAQMWGADEPFAKIGTDEGPTFHLLAIPLNLKNDG